MFWIFIDQTHASISKVVPSSSRHSSHADFYSLVSPSYEQKNRYMSRSFKILYRRSDTGINAFSKSDAPRSRIVVSYMAIEDRPVNVTHIKNTRL